MKLKHVVAFLFIISITSGCNMPVRGTFPDAAQKKGTVAANAVVATNASQSGTHGAVTPVPFSITYSVQGSYLVGEPLDIKSPAIKGGNPISYTVDPTLPEGLELNQKSGEITGTPVEITPPTQTVFTITAATAGDAPLQTSATISIVISGDSSTTPVAKTEEVLLVAGAPMAKVTLTAGPPDATFKADPHLPDDLSIDASGTVSGTPVDVSPAKSYVFTISTPENADVSSETIKITVASVSETGMGNAYGCARMTTGEVSCWNSTTDGRSDAQHVPGMTTASQLATGETKACAIVEADHKVSCWSGLGKPGVPVLLARGGKPLTGAVQVVVAAGHSCALTAAGVLCWGDNDVGQLGLKDKKSQDYPVIVEGLAKLGISQLAARGRHTCAITTGGLVQCWGLSMDPADKKSSYVPVAVTGLDGATAIAVGKSHACAIVGNREAVKCWGLNAHGQLGTGFLGKRPELIEVDLAAGRAKKITVGEHSSCAMLETGKIKCWGANDRGQLGYIPHEKCTVGPAEIPCSSHADLVMGFSTGGITALASNNNGSCATAHGRVQCWGSKFGPWPKSIDSWK